MPTCPYETYTYGWISFGLCHASAVKTIPGEYMGVFVRAGVMVLDNSILFS